MGDPGSRNHPGGLTPPLQAALHCELNCQMEMPSQSMLRDVENQEDIQLQENDFDVMNAGEI